MPSLRMRAFIVLIDRLGVLRGGRGHDEAEHQQRGDEFAEHVELLQVDTVRKFEVSNFDELEVLKRESYMSRVQWTYPDELREALLDFGLAPRPETPPRFVRDQPVGPVSLRNPALARTGCSPAHSPRPTTSATSSRSARNTGR